MHFAVASVGFTSSSYSGAEGTEVNLLVEGDGQNQQPLTVQYSVLRSGTAASKWVHCRDCCLIRPFFGLLICTCSHLEGGKYRDFMLREVDIPLCQQFLGFLKCI